MIIPGVPAVSSALQRGVDEREVDPLAEERGLRGLDALVGGEDGVGAAVRPEDPGAGVGFGRPAAERQRPAVLRVVGLVERGDNDAELVLLRQRVELEPAFDREVPVAAEPAPRDVVADHALRRAVRVGDAAAVQRLADAERTRVRIRRQRPAGSRVHAPGLVDGAQVVLGIDRAAPVETAVRRHLQRPQRDRPRRQHPRARQTEQE